MTSPYDTSRVNAPLTTSNTEVVRRIVSKELERYNEGFEERLAIAIQKALDTVTSDLEARLRNIEEDQAKILRHLGLDR